MSRGKSPGKKSKSFFKRTNEEIWGKRRRGLTLVAKTEREAQGYADCSPGAIIKRHKNGWGVWVW